MEVCRRLWLFACLIFRLDVNAQEYKTQRKNFSYMSDFHNTFDWRVLAGSNKDRSGCLPSSRPVIFWKKWWLGVPRIHGATVIFNRFTWTICNILRYIKEVIVWFATGIVRFSATRTVSKQIQNMRPVCSGGPSRYWFLDLGARLAGCPAHHTLRIQNGGK